MLIQTSNIIANDLIQNLLRICCTSLTNSITNKNLFILNAKGLAKPKFNKSTNKWDKPAGYDEEETYGPVGSLLRQGPGPFITRLSNADKYEQAVLKYMASEGISRLEAQENMDAYFNNAADWAYQKMQEKKRAPKVDYNKIKTKDVALSAIWGLFITPLLLRIVFSIINMHNIYFQKWMFVYDILKKLVTTQL